jgi:hypothetical protein
VLYYIVCKGVAVGGVLRGELIMAADKLLTPKRGAVHRTVLVCAGSVVSHTVLKDLDRQ